MERPQDLELQAQIETYVIGNMDEAERLTFEARMRKDPKLAEEVAIQRAIHFGLSHLDMPVLPPEKQQHIRDILKTIHEEQAGSSQINAVTEKGSRLVKTRRIWLWGLAAVAAVLLLFWLLLPSINQSQRDLQLASEETKVFWEVERGATDMPDSLINQLKQYYISGQYQTGLQALDSLLNYQLVDSNYATFISAYFYAAAGDSASALEALRSVMGSSSSEWASISRFQQAIVYLQFHDRPKARQVLQAIISDPKTKKQPRTDAERLLRQISN